MRLSCFCFGDCVVLKLISFVLLLQFAKVWYLFFITLKTFNHMQLGHTFKCFVKMTVKIDDTIKILFCRYSCCSAHSFSCYRTVSDANYWTISIFFITLTTLCWMNLHQLKSTQWFNLPVDFFEFLSTEFTAFSRQPSRCDHHKASCPRTQQRDQDGGWTQIMRSGSSYNYSFGRAAERYIRSWHLYLYS